MTLLNEIRKNKNLRKIFGNKELKIIEKQLLGVSLSCSEKTRLSRDIRQKFQAIKDISKFSEDFKLKKNLEINNLINDSKEIILESKYFNNIKKIYVFGSFVENKLKLDSDIDIAVEFKNINKKDSTKFRAEISGRVNEKIDVQVFNFLPEKIKKEIKEKGKIIYKNEL